jgi:hypothetical protein
MKLESTFAILALGMTLSLSACNVVLDQGAQDIIDVYDPDPTDTTDYSEPQYTYTPGVLTDARQYRMNKAVKVIKEKCFSCHVTFGDLSARRMYSINYWNGPNGTHPWVVPGDPGSSPVITYLRLSSQVRAIQFGAINAGRDNPFSIDQDGSQDMPRNTTTPLTYAEFTAIWDWIEHMDEASTHVVRIPPGTGANAYTSASNYFTVSAGDLVVLKNDDSSSHYLTGSATSLFSQGPSIGIGASTFYSITRSGMTTSLGGAYNHRDGATNANFFLKAE